MRKEDFFSSAATGLSGEELNKLLEIYHSTPHPLCPIIYKVGENKYEVSPHFFPGHDVWGYQILPHLALARKCGTMGIIPDTRWSNVKLFAENTIIDGRKGSLPDFQVSVNNWSEAMGRKIKSMDLFLLKNGIDAEEEHYGSILCNEKLVSGYVSYLRLRDGKYGHMYEQNISPYVRIGIAF